MFGSTQPFNSPEQVGESVMILSVMPPIEEFP